jgi:biopolymer transport protein ExbB/TolQ
MNVLSDLASFYKGGGFYMHFILALAVVVLAIAVERFIVIGRAASVNSKRLVDDVVGLVGRGDVASARNLTRASNAPAARVALAMLQLVHATEERIQSAADDAATLVLAPLSRRLSTLNLLANVATLLGLLGTIFGLNTAFSAVGAADPTQRSAFLASGISTALNTTAFGLIVAVPTLLLQGYLASLVEGITSQVDEVIIRVGQSLASVNVAGPAQVVPLGARGPATGASSARAAGAMPGGAQ